MLNIYNKITNNDTLNLLDLFLLANPQLVRLELTDHMLWLRDFTRHHPMWEEDDNSHLFEPDHYISPLLDLLYRHNMLLALLKGIPTFQTSAGKWTRPNNVWHSNSTSDLIQ